MRSLPAVLNAFFVGMAIAMVFPSIVFSQSESLTTEDLARRADVVVVGRVTSMRSEWSPDRSRIFTRVTVSVEQHIKGDKSESSVTVLTPGGEVEGVGEVYSHMPRFRVDEQVIVFATEDPGGQLRVVGGDEGKLTVVKDEVTGVHMVSEREPLGVFTSRLKTIVQAQSHEE